MSFVQNNWMLIAVFVLSGGMLIWPFVQRRLSTVKDVTSAEATQLFNRRNAVLLDVREPWEYEASRIDGAKHIPMGDVPARAHQELDPDDHIVVMCHHGFVDAELQRLEAGFKEIYTLQGGIAAWKKDGLPVEK